MGGVIPPFRPEYMDDGFNGSRTQEVLKWKSGSGGIEIFLG